MASYIFINSEDRSYASSTSPSNFSIQINSTVADAPRSSLSVESVTFYNLEYGVNSTNNTLVFRENSDDLTDFTVTITPGNYSASEFVSVLKTAMDAAGTNTYTVSYSSTTGKINITVILPDTFKLVSGTMLTSVIGYEVMTSFVATKTADYPINLAGTSYIDLALGLSNRNIVSGIGQYRPFIRIPVSVGFGSLVEFTNFSDSDETTIATDDLDELNVVMYNDRRQVFDLPRNAVVSIVLKVKSIF
jgi:hypothetical protein